MWTTVGAGAALTCLVAAGLCAGVTFAREGGLGERLSGAVTGTVAGTKRLAQAAVPTPPERATKQQSRRRPQPQPRREQQPQPAPAPVLPPFDHDAPSSEHVYEVANYGW
ncbi:MAG TPA: hypothetical protein VFR49_14045 [Solirubrobacteraceae bacterium]|nr:hypothetical protein [Solirubrobacteraceae bacterium]